MEIYFNYKYATDEAGIADGKFEICVPRGILAGLFWADDNGILEDYLPIKHLPLIDGKGEYTIEGNKMIPEEATRVVCKIQDDSMLYISLPELTINIPEEKRLHLGKPESVVYITSDIHGGGAYFHNTENRNKMWSLVGKAKPDYVLIAGDITNAGRRKEYEEDENSIEKYLKGIPVFISTGNHDYNTYVKDLAPDIEAMHDFFVWQLDRNAKLGVENSELYNNYFASRVNGVQVVVLNQDHVDNKFFLEDEQRAFLDEKLTESDGDRYRFVVTHFPQSGFIGHPKNEKCKKMTSDNDLTQAVLDKHKGVFHISGHTHYNLDSDDVNVKNVDGITYINGGCAVWTGVCCEERREYYIQSRSMGYRMEVYKDRIVFKGVDFPSGKFISRAQHFVNC